MPDELNGHTNEPNWQQFIDGLNKLNENVSGLRGEVRTQTTDDDDDDNEPAATPPPSEIQFPDDFDEWTAKRQHQWMLGTFGKAVTDSIVSQVTNIVNPIIQQQQQTSQGVLEERYTREVTELMNAKGEDGKLLRPDYVDWIEEMTKVVTEMPGISPLRAYNLVRTENPKKAKELDVKYNPPPPPPKSPFSFAPNSGGTSAPHASAKPPSKEEAFKSAVEKVKAKWGDQYALGQREF